MEVVFVKKGILFIGKVKDLKETLSNLSGTSLVKELVHNHLQ